MPRLRLAVILWMGSLAGLALAETPLPTAILPDSLHWASLLNHPAVQSAWILGAEAQPGLYLLRVKLAAKGSLGYRTFAGPPSANRYHPAPGIYRAGASRLKPTPGYHSDAPALLRVAGLALSLRRAVYRPSEVCRLLRISPTTLRQFCELAEHPAVIQREPRALESFLVGCHHRIAHATLVEWRAWNQTFQREVG